MAGTRSDSNASTLTTVAPVGLSMPRILPMPAHLEPDVRELYEECHPGWAPVSPHWFFANPTLVATDDRAHAVVGYTSYTMNVTDAGVLGMYLQDTCVAPSSRGQGLGRRLMETRLEIARSMGAQFVAGVTQPENAPMLHLLTSFGFQAKLVIPGAYKQATPALAGVLFTVDL